MAILNNSFVLLPTGPCKISDIPSKSGFKIWTSKGFVTVSNIVEHETTNPVFKISNQYGSAVVSSDALISESGSPVLVSKAKNVDILLGPSYKAISNHISFSDKEAVFKNFGYFDLGLLASTTKFEKIPMTFFQKMKKLIKRNTEIKNVIFSFNKLTFDAYCLMHVSEHFEKETEISNDNQSSTRIIKVTEEFLNCLENYDYGLDKLNFVNSTLLFFIKGLFYNSEIRETIILKHHNINFLEKIQMMLSSIGILSNINDNLLSIVPVETNLVRFMESIGLLDFQKSEQVANIIESLKIDNSPKSSLIVFDSFRNEKNNNEYKYDYSINNKEEIHLQKPVMVDLIMEDTVGGCFCGFWCNGLKIIY